MSAVATQEKTSLIELLHMYSDLCEEIEYFEVLLNESQHEWSVNRKLMLVNPRKTTNGAYQHTPMDRLAENMDKVIERHNNLERLLKAKRRMKVAAEKILNAFEGIDYKVAYKRFVEKKKLEVIASELNYSIDGIKKISSRITKALTRH